MINMQTKNINQQNEQRINNIESQYEQSLQAITIHEETTNDNGTDFAARPEVKTNLIKREVGVCKSTSTPLPPPYRMPPQPLYNEPANIPGSATPSARQQIHTHSNKFPIEREVILSSCDKNSKIPILNEYHRKHVKSAVSPDVPNIQVAWTEDRSKMYSEVRNVQCYNVANRESMASENYHFYKSQQQMPVLDTTNGNEPSPITNQNDSNGFTNSSKSTGRSHSTPETESTSSNNKAFPSRTYHTIRDMISSRFNKSKCDQSQPAGLNNNDSEIAVKIDEPLSPHSQLAQRGVYLANTQQNRNTDCPPNISGNYNSTDLITQRNQEIRNQILYQQYRERAVDVGHTVGMSQQFGGTSCKTEEKSDTPGNIRTVYQDLRSVPSGSRQSVFDAETPNRFKNSNLPDRNSGRNQQSQLQAAPQRSTNRNNNMQSSGMQNYAATNEISHPISSAYACGKVASSGRTTIDVHRSDQNINSEDRVNTRGTQQEDCSSQVAEHFTQRSSFNKRRPLPGPQGSLALSSHDENQISNDTKYNSNTLERCNIPRAKSNDHLLECNPSRSGRSCVLPDPQFLTKSKSFENLGNDAPKIEIPRDDKIKTSGPLSGVNSDYEKHRNSGHSDSGRGSTIYSSGKDPRMADTSPESSEPIHPSGVKDSPWVDIVETELKHILEPKSGNSVANSITSDNSSPSLPLPAISPDVSSDEVTTRAYKHKSSLYSTKPELTPNYRNTVTASHTGRLYGRNMCNEKLGHQHKLGVSMKSPDPRSSRLPSTLASSSIDLDSMLDDNNSSDENVSTADTRAIRKQLEGLENMYSEVLKLLGVRKSSNTTFGRYQPSDPRLNKRRMHGSFSSLPSSVSSRPIRDRYRRQQEDKKKVVKDLKGINKRFQRLESHVVTLARSVAHLSSEMRTQHLMFQELDVIREELTSLRSQTNMLASSRSQSLPRYQHIPSTEQTNSSPVKLKKLTKFFGDEPPLLRLFLRKLGYEKYAVTFEKERIGLVELPYMTEERLQKLGIPMGPRLRILQEAQMGFPGANENTLCIV